MKGRISSIETMGLVDGPGIRFVVFMQGCNLRCLYCHNPETWKKEEGTEISTDELIKKMLKYKPYFDKSGGGVTFSGGEPLLQPEFLIEMLKLCKENNIHTAIDTAGVGNGDYQEILKYVDLVILDIKHPQSEGYKHITGRENGDFLKFLEVLNRFEKHCLVRHVVVPGITDNDESMIELSKIIKTIKNVDKIELLPYHILGVSKYEKLGIEYRLKDLEPMEKEKIKKLMAKVTEAIQ